jgi:DNA replication and repair protein RecF
MTLRSVSLHNIRSHKTASFQLDPEITLILGKNGAGKTTLLEALYVLLRGSSFRGRDRDMIAHGHTSAEMKLVTSDGERRVRLRLSSDEKAAKEFTVDGKTSLRLPAKHRLPVVLFEPEELRLLSSSPQRRRQFFDDVLSRLDSEYSTLSNRYTRTLLQRNELLKQRETMSQSAWESHLFAWDVKFAELAERLVDKRLAFVALSNQRLSPLYSEMADASHTVRVAYSATEKNYKQHLLKQLLANQTTDSYRGFTGAGPHHRL